VIYTQRQSDRPAYGYGWKGARALDKSLALQNADRYDWFSTEFFWATICHRDGGYDDLGAD